MTARILQFNVLAVIALQKFELRQYQASRRRQMFWVHNTDDFVPR